ncbi:MAG: hypothetical protein J6A09_00275 [Alphaproteobacteria bacterium]|nr:hypothetical protein [Alphaproteobacteria bacterium]
MITLFISTVGMWYGLILFTLIGLYGLSRWMLFRYNTLSERIRKMTDKELLDFFDHLVQELVARPSLWKEQELNESWQAYQDRELIKKMSDDELVFHCDNLSVLCKAFEHSNRWHKRLALVQEEMKKRHLL